MKNIAEKLGEVGRLKESEMRASVDKVSSFCCTSGQFGAMFPTLLMKQFLWRYKS